MRRQATQPKVQKALDRLVEYLDAAPPSARRELQRRLESKHESDFQGAFWELYLGFVLNTIFGDRLSWQSSSQSGSVPDFQIELDDGPVFIEATTIQDRLDPDGEA